MKLIAFFLLFISSGTFAQTSNIQNLIDTALKNPGSLIIHIKPLKSTSLDPTDMSYYMENAKEYSKKVLDTFMFAQIIRNSNHTDTSFWTDAELPTFLLVHERNESISRRYAIQKLRPKDQKETRHISRYINEFNTTDPSDRNIIYYSRPVFDDSKRYAVIQWDNGHSWLDGGGRITLYQLQSDNTWMEYSIILNWRY